MQMTGLARLGRDAEIRTTQSGQPVASLSLAFNYGLKAQDGNRPTQWVDAALWGKRAEVLVPYLKKGKQIVVTIDDPHIEEYDGRNGRGHKLAGTVSQIELVPDGQQRTQEQAQDSQRAAAPAPAPPRPPAAQAPRAASGFDDGDDDIPF